MARCIDEIIRASGGTMNRAQAEQIMKAVENKFARLKRSPRDESADQGRTFRTEPPLEQDTRRPDTRSFEERLAGAPRPQPHPIGEAMSDSEALKQAATEAHADAVTRAERALRVQKLQVEQVARSMAEVARNGNGNKGTLELLKRDVEGRGNALANNLITIIWGPLHTFLQERGQWGMTGRKPTREAALELLNLLRDPDLTKRLAGHEGKWTSTERLAYKIREALGTERNRKNSLGADIGELRGYGGPQSWDALAVKWFGLNLAERWQYRPTGGDQGRQTSLMRKARNAWVEYTFPLVDRARYTDETGAPLNDQAMKDVLDQIWNTIADHGAAKNEISGDGNAVEGMAAHRELHFKDAASWYEANSRFGTHDLIDGIMGKLNRAGREIALMETFGPFLERGYKTVQAWAGSNESRLTGHGSEGKRLLDDYFAELAGRTGGVSEMKYALIARTMSTVRTWLSASLLGSLPFSQLPDAATLFAMAKYNTGSHREMFEVLKILNPVAKADRELARLHGFLTDSMIHDVMRHMNQESANAQGFAAKTGDLVMTVSGATLWTDSLKLAGQLHSGYWLAKTRRTSWDKLDPVWKSTLERYHIDAAAWDLIRSAQVTTIRGMEIMTPADLFRVQHPREMDAPAADAPALRREANDAAIRAVDLILAEADIMVLTPDAFTRSRMHTGTQAGTLTGELSRSFWMFKSFTLAMMEKVLPRLASVEPGNTLAFKAELILGLLGAGALAVQLQTMGQGKNPQDMNFLNKKGALFWVRALSKSGGAGMFGDVLFQDYSNAMEGIGRFAVGPTGAALTDPLAYLYGNLNAEVEGKEPNWGSDAVRTGKRYIPLANLWYARAALDHLLFNRATEAMNPGYLRRMGNRLQRQNGTSWWWSPSDTTPDSAPDLSTAWSTH